MHKTKLQQLDLSHIRMSLTGARTLANCLPTLTGLTDLMLQRNSLNDECIEALAPSLDFRVNRGVGLQRVVLFHNSFTTRSWQTLSDRVRQVCIMSRFDLDPLLCWPFTNL